MGLVTSKEATSTFGPTPRFATPMMLGTRIAYDEDDQFQPGDTFEDYFADFQEMFSIGEAHYSVAAGFISKKVQI